ncbi:CapA family protein [Candidatus Sulfidibacterium hydrothermale]|uniref:CapA family protein n=1 Tax=Candidatus Sulfidibacterium hydrothermale TaxID=2875962 RepID=UPI001F0B105E|nr:CapA family protein [Candidatus Sulfidibacterium hydrothermale]UBM62462.1 CapA family protein [Candidatus Sulfidibacterium hydrothermale]
MRLGFVGDICPASIEGDFVFSNDVLSDFLKSDILEQLRSSDYNIGNLECPFTNSNKKIKKIGPSIKANFESIGLLNKAKINIVSLANNHIKDFDGQGIDDTINICSKNNILTFGAGTSRNKIRNNITIESGNKKIGIISYAENEFNENINEVGTSNTYHVLRQILSLKEENVDYIIIFAHGGNEHFHYPSPEKQQLYRFFIDIGANLVVGHHPHCIQGMEIYKESPIFYSLGNFFFPSTRGFEQAHIGFYLLLEINERGLNYKTIPYKQNKNNYRINILSNKEKKQFLDFFDYISKIILDKDQYEKKWKEFIRKKQNSYLKSLLPVNKYVFALLKRTGFINYIFNESFLMSLLNNIRCESHRENLIEIIKLNLYKDD